MSIEMPREVLTKIVPHDIVVSDETVEERILRPQEKGQVALFGSSFNYELLASGGIKISDVHLRKGHAFMFGKQTFQEQEEVKVLEGQTLEPGNGQVIEILGFDFCKGIGYY